MRHVDLAHRDYVVQPCMVGAYTHAWYSIGCKWCKKDGTDSAIVGTDSIETDPSGLRPAESV